MHQNGHHTSSTTLLNEHHTCLTKHPNNRHNQGHPNHLQSAHRIRHKHHRMPCPKHHKNHPSHHPRHHKNHPLLHPRHRSHQVPVKQHTYSSESPELAMQCKTHCLRLMYRCRIRELSSCFYRKSHMFRPVFPIMHPFP